MLICISSRSLKAGENPVWKIQSGMEECTFPWLYPTGEGGELDIQRPIPLKCRDYYKLRLMSADKRWKLDCIWIFRAMNLIQREDLCAAVNYHVKKQFKHNRLCYNIYPGENINSLIFALPDFRGYILTDCYEGNGYV